MDLSRQTTELRPGTILGREWNGQMQQVAVLADGFAWNGNTYPSLSKAAFAITGTALERAEILRPARQTSEGVVPMKTGSRNEPLSFDLYPRLDRPRTRTRLQLARRPV